MKQITIKMAREIDEHATEEIKQYAHDLAAKMAPGYYEFAYNLIICGGNCVLNSVLRYLIKQLDEEEQR